MKRLIAVLCVLMLGLGARVHAATVNLDFLFRVDFTNLAFGTAVGLPAASLFSGRATFDDAWLSGGQYTIPSDGSAGSFQLNFGSFVFTHTNDNFGGPVVRMPTAGGFPGLQFETEFSLPSGSAAGSYLLTFNDTVFQVTPAGNTVDFQMTGVAAVPEPSQALMLLAGLGVLGLLARRARRIQ